MTRPYVLLADGDPNVLRTRRRWLEAAGFTVETASSGPECLDAARACLPQIAVINAALPGLSGLDICRRIKEDLSFANCLIVVQATPDRTAQVSDWLDQGADDCFPESISRSAFIARLQALQRLQQKLDTLNTTQRRSELLFNESPIPTLAADYSAVTDALRRLTASGVTDFRAYFDDHPEAVVACVAHLRGLRVNQENARFFGVATVDDVSLKLSDYFVDESWAVIKEGLILFAQGETRFESEFRLRLPSGQKRDVHLHIRCSPGEAGSPDLMVISFADLSELQRIQEDLEATELSARALINALPAAAFLVALDGTILDINAFAATALGGTVSNLRGRSLFDMMDPDRRVYYEGQAAQAIRTGAPVRFKEQRHGRSVDVGVYPINDGRGRARRLAVVGIDITESEQIQAELELHRNRLEVLVDERTSDFAAANYQLRAEIIERQRVAESLRQAQLEYQTVADFTHDWEYWENPDGTLRYISPSCENLTGWRPEQFIAQPDLMRTVILEQDRTIWDAHHADTEHGRGLRGIHNLPGLPSRDGDIIWVEHGCSRVEQADGTFLGYRGSNRDVTERMRAEALLRQNEERYHSLVEDLPVGVLRSTPSGQILDVNSAIVSVLGYPDRDTLMGINASQIYVNAQDREDFRSTVEREGFATGYEAQVLRYDGATIWVGWSARCVRDPQGGVLYYETTMEDITLWRQAVVDLRESEARYRAVVQDDTSLICRFSLNGNLTFVNSAYCRVAGKTQEQLLGASFLDRVLPEDRLLAARSLTTLTPASPVRTYFHRVPGSQGETGWQEWTDRAIFDADGFLVEYQGVGRDATEHKRADVALQEAHDELEARVAVRTAEILIANLQLHEQISERERIEDALRESETQFRQLVTLAQEGIWVTDAQGQTTFANPRMEQMLGYGGGEIIGASIFSFMQPEAVPAAQAELERRKRGMGEGGDFAFVRSDGSTMYANLAVTALDNDGAGESTLIVVADMTERRLAEDSLRRAKEAADLARSEEQQRRREAERRRQIAEGVGEIMEALNSNQTLDETLAIVMARASELLVCPLLILYRIDEEDGELTIRYVQGAEVESVSATDVRIATITMDQALQQMQAVLVRPVADVLLDCGCAFDGDASADLAARYGTVMAVPITIKGELYGEAQLYFEGEREFSNDERDLAVVLGRQTALAVENARLRESRRAAVIAAERNRLARDLHDAVTQTLFSANLIADALPLVWRRDPDKGMQGLRDLRVLTRGALAEMRSLLMELRPAVIEEKPLPDILRQLAESLTARTTVPVTVALDEAPALPPAVKVAFYRIAQEALNNVIKHASASCAELTLQTRDGHTLLTVSDDGIGFNPALARPSQLGVGIMRERARQVGAGLLINSSLGQGTRIIVVWPAEGGQAADDED